MPWIVFKFILKRIDFVHSFVSFARDIQLSRVHLLWKNVYFWDLHAQDNDVVSKIECN